MSKEGENIRTNVAESIAWSLHLENQTELEMLINYHYTGTFTLSFEERETICQVWQGIEDKKLKRVKDKLAEARRELKEKIAKEKEKNDEEEPSSED